jgi:hypothetical protein
MRATGVYAALGASMAAVILTGGVSPGGDLLGSERVASNAAAMLDRLEDRGGALGLVLVVALGASLAQRPRAARRAWLSEWWRQSVLARVGRVPVGVLLAGLAGLFALPFLLNRRYFADYYTVFPAVGLSLLAARMLARAWPERGRLLGLTLAAGLALASVPWRALEEAREPGPDNDVASWVEEAGAALRDLRPPVHVAIVARCREHRDTARSLALLDGYRRASSDGDGVRWSSGLGRSVRVTFGEGTDGERADRVLRYCEAEPARFALER